MSRTFHAICLFIVVSCLATMMIAVASYEQYVANAKRPCPKRDCHYPSCPLDDYDACSTGRGKYCPGGYCVSKIRPPEDITCEGRTIPLALAHCSSNSLAQ